jgi:hypothetical protein
VELLEPESQIEFSGDEVAASDEAEDGVLDFGGEFGEGVAGAGAGDGVELVEAELVIEGERALRGEGEGLAGTGGEGGVEVGRDVLWSVTHEDAAGDSLQGGELRGAQVLGDVDGAGVDKLLKAKAGSGLGDRSRRGEILLRSTNGHDTNLPDVSGLRLTFVCLLDDGKGRKSFFCEHLVLPQRWYVGLVEIVGFVDNRALISGCGKNRRT